VLAAVVCGLAAFAVYGGHLFTDAVSFCARKYLSSLENLSVTFDRFSGSLSDGFKLTGLSAGDRKDAQIITVRTVFVSFDFRQSWNERRLIFSGSAEGLRLKESQLNSLIEAAGRDFPSDGSPSEPAALFALTAPQELKAVDCAGTLGWSLEKLDIKRTAPGTLNYELSLNGQFRGEPVSLSGTAALSEKLLPVSADVRLSALKSSLHILASAAENRISVQSIEGTLFDSPVKGSASLNAAEPDPAVAADLKLAHVNFRQLRAIVPDLEAASLESLTAHLTGTLSKPQGTAVLKNGSVTWQNYKISSINSRIDFKGTAGQLDLSADAFGTSLSASGTFGLSPNSALNIKASAGPLDLSVLSGFVPETADAGLSGTVNAAASVTGTLASPKVKLNIASPKVTVQKEYVLSDISAVLDAGLTGVNIEKLSLAAFSGRISAGGSIGLKGKTPSLNISGKAEGIDLSSVIPGGTVKGIFESQFTIRGPLTKPEIELAADVEKIDAAQFGAKNIRLTVRGSDRLAVQLNGLTKFDTPFGGGGTVVLPSGRRKSSLDLKFDLKSMKLAELFPNTMKFAGEVTAALLVSGSFEKPGLSAQLQSPKLNMNGYEIRDILANAVLKGSTADVSASLALGDRRAAVTGKLDFRKKFKAVFDLSAPTFRIDALSPALQGVVDGRATLESHAVVTDTAITAQGRLTSPMLSAGGIPVMNVRIPFDFRQNKISVPDGTLQLGGGTVHIKADGDLNEALYTYSVSGQAIDLGKLAQPLKLPAEVSGTAAVSFNGKSQINTLALTQGSGRVTLKEISVDKYPGQAAVTGKNPFRIKNGIISFTLDDNEVYVMPGSSIAAWPDDSYYHFIAFSGTAWQMPRSKPNLDPSMMPADLVKNKSDMYHMLINGSINVRVLNGLLGGLGAVLDAGASGNMSTENIASNILQKMIGGSISSQFRAFDLDIAGKDYSEFRINKLKFEGQGSYADVATTDWTEDSGTRTDQQRYSLSYPVPIGPNPAKTDKKESRKKQ
jgi:autotransporter translocation and assembly factor TamB